MRMSSIDKGMVCSTRFSISQEEPLPEVSDTCVRLRVRISLLFYFSGFRSKVVTAMLGVVDYLSVSSQISHEVLAAAILILKTSTCRKNDLSRVAALQSGFPQLI